MTDSEMRFVQVPMHQYEAMRAQISAKVNSQFTRKELEMLLFWYCTPISACDEPDAAAALRNKIYLHLRDAEE